MKILVSTLLTIGIMCELCFACPISNPDCPEDIQFNQMVGNKYAPALRDFYLSNKRQGLPPQEIVDAMFEEYQKFVSRLSKIDELLYQAERDTMQMLRGGPGSSIDSGMLFREKASILRLIKNPYYGYEAAIKFYNTVITLEN